MDSSWSEADDTTSGFVTQLDTPASEGNPLLEEDRIATGASPVTEEPGDEKNMLLSNTETGQMLGNITVESTPSKEDLEGLLGNNAQSGGSALAAAVPGNIPDEELALDEGVENSSELDTLIVPASDAPGSVRS